MEENKGFWYVDWLFLIFVGLFFFGVFVGMYMYYLYGIGVFNEVVFVVMLKVGMDIGVYGVVVVFGVSFLFVCIIEGLLVGILDIGGVIQIGVGLGVLVLLLGVGFVFLVVNFIVLLIIGLVIGLVIGYIIILVCKFIINQSDFMYGVDVMMGVGNILGCFLGLLIIFSVMMVLIFIGLGFLVGVLLFYIWQKLIIGGVILGVMIFGFIFLIVIS